MAKYIYADKKPVGIEWKPTRDISGTELVITVIGVTAIVAGIGYFLSKRRIMS